MDARALIVVQSLLGLGLAVGSIAFWFVGVSLGEGRFRSWVAQRFRVSIGRGPHGHWKVSSDEGSSGKHCRLSALVERL